ncbi:putative RNA-directed DNA polymerase [Helianthus debilis subsp. tardiflorus]
MLHMDLFGPVQVMSLKKKRYCLVIVDDFSRFTWTFFLHSKDETAGILQDFVTQVEKQFDLPVKSFRSDNGTEFKNKELDAFCVKKGIVRQYSIPRTLEQNGVVERKNRTLIEAARTMLADSGFPLTFWAEAVNTACYVQNRVLINPRHKKTAYEILYKIKPLISYFKVFGCPCFILNLKDSISKFAAKIDCGYFLGYSTTAKAYKVFNARTKVVEETLDVKFNELSSMRIPANPADMFDLEKFTFENTAVKTNSAGPSEDTSPDYGYEIIIPQRSATKGKTPVVQNSCQSSTTATSTVVDQSSPSTTASTSSNTADKSPQTVDKSQQWSTPLPPIPPPFEATAGSSKSPAVVSSVDTHLQPSPTNAIIPYQGDLIFLRSHPPDQIIGNINEGVLTRSQTQNICLFAGFLSPRQPVKYQEALKDNSWVEAMQEELQQFKRQQVWELVPLPEEVSVTPPKSTCGVSPLGSVTDQDQATNHIEHVINDKYK